ncbi:MAG: substrate-binding domain-containing protein [Thermoplasmatota archaeon]
MQVIAASLYAKLLKQASVEAGIPADVRAEGSVAGARDVQLAPSTYSLFASVDPAVITSLLSPTIAPWYVTIAWDRMVIGYYASAPAASQLANLSQAIERAQAEGRAGDALNATASELDLVLSSGSRIGTTNPDTDPEGYRAILVLELVGLQKFGDPSHYLTLLEETRQQGRLVTLDAGSKLFGLVQSGAVDYDIALYESAASSASIPHARLAGSVDLGDATRSPEYALASTTIKSGPTTLTIKGAPISLALTIPREAPDADDAVRLILHLISPAGEKEMEALGIRPLDPARFVGNTTNAPHALQDWIGSPVLEAT